jgi:hypothetical protein
MSNDLEVQIMLKDINEMLNTLKEEEESRKYYNNIMQYY